MMESGIPICKTCGEQVGLNSKGEVFVACNECNYPICQHCLDYEIKEDRTSCIRCATPYAEDGAAVAEESGNHIPTIHTSQETGVHARKTSTVSTIDSEYMDDSGNPIWKNRVESWKDKKNKKNKAPKKDKKAEIVPSEQQMDDQPH